MRKRLAAVFAVFAVGCLVGAGVSHVLRPGGATPAAEPDLVPPAILAVEPTEGVALPAGPSTFRVSFSEPLAGIPTVRLSGPMDLSFEEWFDGLTWRGDVSIPDGADGSYALTIGGVVDHAGLEAPGLSLRYVVDTIPPTSRARIASSTASAPFDIAWDASDGNGSGVSRVELWGRLDDGAYELLTASPEDRGAFRFSPARKARVDAFALAADRAGNREAAPGQPDATVRFDPSPPGATLVPVAAYWHHSPVSASAVTSGDIAGVDLRYHFAADNATWQGPFTAGTATAPYAWTFPFPLGPGHYRLHARARAADGTWEDEQGPEDSEIALGYDVTAPTADVDPVSPYWRAEPMAVNVTAADAVSGVGRVDLVYAHRPHGTAPWSPWILAATRTAAPWTFDLAFPAGDGRYALAAKAVDRAGWESPLPDPDGAVGVGFNRDAPSAPLVRMPRWVDPLTRHANVTWSATPEADLVAFEVHRGTDRAFVPSPCPGATCVVSLDRDARAAWVPLPAENVTYWIRIVAVDDGGLASAGEAVGAAFHGLGFDTPGSINLAVPLPVGVAWSERLDWPGKCVDCTDAFAVTLDRGEVLVLGLAVPLTGDFRIWVTDNGLRVYAMSETPGFGVWESIVFEATVTGTYYVLVDWSSVSSEGANEGWYTLTSAVA